MSSVAQRYLWVGKQTVAGTSVAPDVALRASASFKPVPKKIVADEDIGSFAPGRNYIGEVRGEGAIKYDAYYEHLPVIISMALGDGSVVNGDPDVWSFPLPDATPDTFALWTLEYSDGVSHVVRATDVFAKDLEIKGEAGGSWMITPGLAAGNTILPGSGSTPVTPPTAAVVPLLMAKTSLYIDALYANIGTTVAGILISFTWKLENYQHNKLFAGSLYPTGFGWDKWKVTLELLVEVDDATVQTLKAKLLTLGQTAIQIKEDSQNVNGILDYYCKINGMYYLDAIDTLDNRDGNNTLKMSYIAEKDLVAGAVGGIEIANCLTAL